MIFNFGAAIAAIGGQAAVTRIANAARPSSDYLFATLLPEQARASYVAESGTMTIRPTMAGVSGLDSMYAKVGSIELSSFLQEVAKITSEITLSEKLQREMQEWLLRTGANEAASQAFLQNQVLNFLNKLVLQPHLDRMEWLRGQALVTGEIDWTFNQKNVAVDYGIPADNLFATRTGNDAYGGSASVWWEDVREARRILRGFRAVIANSETLDAILYNEANQLEVIGQTDTTFRVRRLVGSGTNLRPATDVRETVELIAYDAEGEVFDLTNPGQTVKVPFMPAGSVLFVGRTGLRGFRVGEGATEDPDNDLAVGYTHIAPTIEGGGVPGRWARVRVPDDRPWQLEGQGVTNGIPVIENPDAIVVASTDL